jgi:CHRD domain
MTDLRHPVVVVVAIWTIILMSNISFAQVSFRTELVGEKEVPPLFSESYGSALIVGNDSSLKYQINVSSLGNITGAFLFKGDETENGELLVSFLNSTKPSGVMDGKLVEGTINSSSILVPLANLTTNMTLAVPGAGNLTNMTSAVSGPSKLEALIDLMNQNMTYINIHTSKFPDGELRGTLTNSTE